MMDHPITNVPAGYGERSGDGDVIYPAAPRAVASFFRAFFISLIVAIAALSWLRVVSLPTETFSEDTRRWIMNLLPAGEIAELKVGYASSMPVYDVGLFGNSRILMVGGDEIGHMNGRMFNFAVPGQSIRQSINLMEQLQDYGKLPPTVIVSMDHAELGLQGGAAVYPGPPSRWLQALVDVRTAWQMDGLRSALVHIVNTLAAEALDASLTFNHHYVLAKLRAMFGTQGDLFSQYRIDGSRKERVLQGQIEPLPRRADRYLELEYDFRRLAALRKFGIRVVVYESPVAPQIVRSDSDLSLNARDVRRRFHAACAMANLECLGPPLLASRPWFDRDHAPAASLAEWLREIIDGHR